MTARMNELLHAAAVEFEHMSSPFAGDWLSDHDVTLNECGDLSESIANAIRVYLETSTRERTRILAMSLFREPLL